MVAGRGGRPSLGDAARIEGRILDVARDLFFAHGYGATSIEAIAKAAAMSKRTLYARFANKAELFRAVVNRLVTGLVPPDISGLFEGPDCATILATLARAMLAASLSPQALALQRVVVAEAARFPELGLVMSGQGMRQEAIRRIASLLERETASGRLAVAHPARAAELFMQMVVGLPQRRALGLGTPMTPVELEAWANDAVHIFLHGCTG